MVPPPPAPVASSPTSHNASSNNNIKATSVAKGVSSENFTQLPVETWLKFTNTIAGRDKIYRTIQYLTRFLMYSYGRQPGHDKDILDRIAKLSLATGMTRKLLRAGKTLDHLQNFLKARFTIPEDVLRLTSMGKSAGLGLWLIFDFLQWLHTTGVYPFSPAAIQKINQRAAFFWLLSLISGWLQCLYSFRVNWIRTDFAIKASTSNRPEDKNLNETGKKMILSLHKERDQIVRDWMIATADILIPTNTLGIFPTNLGVVGLAGTFSSLLGAYSLWPSQN